MKSNVRKLVKVVTVAEGILLLILFILMWHKVANKVIIPTLDVVIPVALLYLWIIGVVCLNSKERPDPLPQDRKPRHIYISSQHKVTDVYTGASLADPFPTLYDFVRVYDLDLIKHNLIVHIDAASCLSLSLNSLAGVWNTSDKCRLLITKNLADPLIADSGAPIHINPDVKLRK